MKAGLAPEFMHEAIRLSLEKMRAGCCVPFGAIVATSA